MPLRTESLLAAATVAYAVAGSLTSPLSMAALIAVVVPVAGATAWTLARPPRPRPEPSRPAVRRTALAWAAVVVLAGTWELVAWLRQPAYNVASAQHPTISVLLDPVTEAQPGRLLAWAGWLAAGWWLVRR
ncbi:MAG TPA: hypothetical protein VIW24_15475 [Aldersonia sp.]